MSKIKLFESKQVRTLWDENKKKWFFAIIDVVEILTGSERPRKYWNDLKVKLDQEGYIEVSEKIGQLKMKAKDGKMRSTDVADTETLLRIVQSIPSPKAEPFKRWLARVGYERLEEIGARGTGLDIHTYRRYNKIILDLKGGMLMTVQKVAIMVSPTFLEWLDKWAKRKGGQPRIKNWPKKCLI